MEEERAGEQMRPLLTTVIKAGEGGGRAGGRGWLWELGGGTKERRPPSRLSPQRGLHHRRFPLWGRSSAGVPRLSEAAASREAPPPPARGT